MNKNIITIIKGGLIATTAMTLLMLVAPMMGMPKMHIGEMLANFMHIPVTLGWVAHFVVGTVLAAMHEIVWKKRLPAGAVVNAMIFSLIPFLVAQIMVMPMMGAGFFSLNTPAPMMMVMGSLMGHLVYGAVLGAVTK